MKMTPAASPRPGGPRLAFNEQLDQPRHTGLGVALLFGGGEQVMEDRQAAFEAGDRPSFLCVGK